MKAAVAAAGGTVVVEEVTIVASNGVRTRLDLVVRLPSNDVILVEVKFGPNATWTTNQKATFDLIRTKMWTAVGERGIRAGFPHGVPQAARRLVTIFLE